MIKHLLSIAAVLLIAPAARATGTDANEMLKHVDNARSPQTAYQANVSVNSIRPGKPTRSTSYELWSKGSDSTLIKTLTPETDRGRLLLMKGKDVWAYLPTISKPLRLSLRERLIGEASNADVARANFSGDYNAEMLRSETVKGKSYDVLRLTATAPDVAYSRVLLWVEQGTYSPFQAQFYGNSGRVLKTCTYLNYRPVAGQSRPTRLVLTDPLIKDQYTVIDYKDFQVQDIPDKFFTESYLKKLGK